MKIEANVGKNLREVIAAFVPKAPDAIMAELWRVKAKLNADAGYDVDRLIANARANAKAHILEASKNDVSKRK
jgi:hypothetical protein